MNPNETAKRSSRCAPFACDVYIFNLYSPTPYLILGPRGANAHAIDEWVMIEDLIALTKIFALTAAEWRNQPIAQCLGWLVRYG